MQHDLFASVFVSSAVLWGNFKVKLRPILWGQSSSSQSLYSRNTSFAKPKGMALYTS